MFRNILAVLAASLAVCASLCAQTVITLDETGEAGKYTIQTTVNGVGVLTYYTEENWFVSLSTTTYLFLYENGYIQDSDVKGLTNLKMPDGSSTKAASFLIRSLRIGDKIVVKDIPAFVIKKQTVPLLIGSSTFDSFGEYTRQGNRIIIGDLEPDKDPSTIVDPIDSLKQAAQAFLDAGEYESAGNCFSQLYEKDALNMLTQYQYAILLGMLGKDEENIRVSNDWLASNEHKSLTMDYWINNGLGASYARLNQNINAMDSFGKAVQAYCKLFNTSETEVKKGKFHDETLGSTFYSLGRLYAAEGKVSKAESYCSLAAKCGIQAAIDFCDKYKIKY